MVAFDSHDVRGPGGVGVGGAASVPTVFRFFAYPRIVPSCVFQGDKNERTAFVYLTVYGKRKFVWGERC